MSSYLIDTHCHLHDREFFSADEAESFLSRARENQVDQIICIGTNSADSLAARDFALSHDDVFWTYGIHPEFASRPDIPDNATIKSSLTSELVRNSGDDDLQDVGMNGDLPFEGIRSYGEEERHDPATAGAANAPRENVSRHSPSRLVGIGEIGLDYHYAGYSRAAQIKLFEQMLSLATDLNLPVSLHIREAFVDAFAVLDNFPHIRGVVHSFTGNKRELKQALERGLYVGVNGLATYTTPPLPPLEKMLLETDAPFLTPEPFRGKMNSPEHIRDIAKYLSGKLGVAEDLIAEQTTSNARQLFHLDYPSIRLSDGADF